MIGGVNLGCLMTPGFSKDIGVMYDHTVLNCMVRRGRMGTFMKEGEREVGGFGPFNDTWSQ